MAWTAISTSPPAGTAALDKLTEARRAGLTELLDGWNPEEHPEIIAMVKDLAHSLLADDERLVADAMPARAGGRVRWRGRRRAGRRGLSWVASSSRPGSAIRAPSRKGLAEGGGRSVWRRVLGVEPDERGTEHGRGVEADEDGARCGGVDAGGHAGVKGGVGRVEDAAAEDDLDRLVLQVEPDDGGPDEGGDLVGEDVGRLAGGGVALGRRVEEDAGELEEPGVGDGAACRCRSARPPRRAFRAARALVRATWWRDPDRRRPAGRGRGRAGRARRRRARSLPTARPVRGSAPSVRPARRRRSSCPFRTRRRCPSAPSSPPARRRTCRCAG